ncbi:MAG: site-specific integrase [Ignavibacteriaceae bacterium]|jgi:site-specific recombinase XerD|nr:site-specific integrase [Ignavibacterium sp.]MCU0364119.1 site-specific integrase [Ignavibacteriaceae bacterium]
MSTVRFDILKDRSNKSGRHPIVLRITAGSFRKYIYSGYYCFKEEWDEETESVTSNYSAKSPSRTLINSYLTKYKAKAQEIHDQYIRDGITDYTPDQFITAFGNRSSGRITVFKAFSVRIEELQNSGREGYSRVFKNVLSVFKTFRDGKDLFLSDLTPKILEEWIYYLKDKRGVADISINNYLRTTRTLFLYAIKMKWVRSEYYPFREIKVSEFSIETSPRALDELNLEELLKLETYPDLQLAKDIFVFSFFGRGISFIDMVHLTAKNIQDGNIFYERKKLAKKPVRVTFPIRKEIEEILQKYNDPERSYLLPILDVNKHISQQQKIDRIHKVRGQINRDLKTIGKQIGIENLTSYWARHTYASYMFRKGMPVMMIKESLRHKSVKTTEIYLKSLGLDAITDFEDQIYNDL